MRIGLWFVDESTNDAGTSGEIESTFATVNDALMSFAMNDFGESINFNFENKHEQLKISGSN